MVGCHIGQELQNNNRRLDMTAPIQATAPFSKVDRITFMLVGGMIGLGIVAVIFLQ
jgi:hypothetical protein